MLYILDTDILSLLQDSHPAVVTRVAQCATNELATTVITVEEQLSGWYHLLRQARTPDQVVFAYDQLAGQVASLALMHVARYSHQAIARYEQLRQMKLTVRKPDLRIGAIALEHNATVVTRNTRDFAHIPGLTIEDWSK